MAVHLRVLTTLCVVRAFVPNLACGPVKRTTTTYTPLRVPQYRPKPRAPTAPSRLDEVIRNANHTINGDKITLAFPPEDVPSSTAVTKPVVKRPNVGQKASFVCDTSNENASTAVIWTHQGATVAENGHSLDPQYDVIYRDQVAILSIINVTFASSGEVTCYQILNATTTILKRYSLHPNVHRAADVFSVPMPNWSIEKGSTEAIYCEVRLKLPLQMVKKASELYLWRFNNRTVVAPVAPPYNYKSGSLTYPKKLSVLNSFVYDFPTSTLTFSMRLIGVDVDDSGPVECWFRATPDVDEWFIQSAVYSVSQPVA